jgi:uncharacterized membrane protein YhaH (DUF805 family)
MRIGRLGFVVGQACVAACGLLVGPIASLHLFHVHPDLGVQIGWIALAIASLTLTVWRCHDYNRTFWHNFWADQVPVIGPFVAMYELLATPGSVGMNSYGMPPRF